MSSTGDEGGAGPGEHVPSDPLVEAIPNVSEGRNDSLIDDIAAAMDGDGAAVLHVDRNADAHRTVFTVAGPLSRVVAGLRRGFAAALDGIDMRAHHGAHPRIGAVDVAPLVLLAQATGGPPGGGDTRRALQTMAQLARWFGEVRGVPTWLYEESATREQFRTLPNCRRGGYEGLVHRLGGPRELGPDHGPTSWNESVARSGATVLGVRPLLVAANYWLDTEDVGLARDLARRLRTAGGGPESLPGVRAVGWKLATHRRAQVSCNLYDPLRTRPIDVLRRLREISPVGVPGMEPIGLLPARSLLGERGVDGAGSGGGPLLRGWDEGTLSAALDELGFTCVPGTATDPPIDRILERRLAARGFLGRS